MIVQIFQKAIANPAPSNLDANMTGICQQHLRKIETRKKSTKQTKVE